MKFSEVPEVAKWIGAVISLALSANLLANFFGYERTTPEQRLEVFKAEQDGYHRARDSAQRLTDSTILSQLDDIKGRQQYADSHLEDILIGECAENPRTELAARRRFGLIAWCQANNVPFMPEPRP